MILTSRFWRRLAIIAVILGGCAALAWTSLGRWQLPAFGPRQLDYYNLLAGGFHKGSLALDVEVPEALKRAKNPLELFSKHPEVALHDVSYFNGHFYIYYGVVPVVVLFWPFRALTGHDLPLVLGSLSFGIGAFLVSAWLWLRIVRDHFPRAGLATRFAGIAALGLAGGQWVLARRVSIWEPSIVAGNFFLVCMLACGQRALHSRRPWGWLSLCGLALGLAAGSRPTLVVAGLGLAVLVAAVGMREDVGCRQSPLRRTLKAALAAGIPLAVVGVGLLAYNWGRFGNPLEFGLNYQLSTWNGVKKSHFRPSFVPYNFFLYFLVPPQWGRYFPFVHPIAAPLPPDGYYGYEYVYGALVVCPVLWWIVFVPACLRWTNRALRSFAAAVFAVAIAVTSVILCFDTAAARYETDFLPWWVLLALLGWCLIEDWARASRGKALPWLLSLAFCTCAAFSCAAAFCASAELHGILQFDNPDAYRRISRAFNMPTAAWERLTGYRGGAVQMDVAFAPRSAGSFEPLVVTGVGYQMDYVYVYYQGNNVVRLCYSHPGEPVASSTDVAIEPSRSYAVRIECGSLFPPEGHPAYDGWQPVEVNSLKHWVKIDFGGRTVLSDSRGSNEASPGTLRIGTDPGGFYGRRFTGIITQVHRVGWRRPEIDLRPPGDFDVVVSLPSQPLTQCQPLLAAGRPGSADLVGLRMNDSEECNFVAECWGVGFWQSRAVPVSPDRRIAVRIRLGALLGLDDRSPLGILSRSVVIWRDGAPIWWHHTAYPLGPHPQLFLMSNALGSSVMAPVFQGRLVSARRTPAELVWRTGPFRALEMRLGDRGSGVEPLVATGITGQSDTLAIDWREIGRVRLLYDHWGEQMHSSEYLEWPEGTLRSVRVEMPSFSSLDAPGRTESGAGRLRVSVDGTVAWEASVSFHYASSASVAVGRNFSGSSVPAPELSCAVVGLRQE